MEEYTLGLSPCPNDTFIFHALLHGLIKTSFGTIKPLLCDVEALNGMAVCGKLPFSKVSIGAYPYFCDTYSILSSGAALGFGCGPLVVARKDCHVESESASVAIPGAMTTANLLLTVTDMFHGKRQEMLFSDIIGAVCNGQFDYGVIIHEGRFTYASHGLRVVLDLGAWWEEHFSLPLPLGAICVRNDVPKSTAKAFEQAIEESVRYGWEHPLASKSYIKEHAQELADSVIEAHIATFVTKYSCSLDQEAKDAIEMLVGKALERMGKKKPKSIFL